METSWGLFSSKTLVDREEESGRGGTSSKTLELTTERGEGLIRAGLLEADFGPHSPLIRSKQLGRMIASETRPNLQLFYSIHMNRIISI